MGRRQNSALADKNFCEDYGQTTKLGSGRQGVKIDIVISVEKYLSNDVAFGSDITPCIKIDKLLVV